MTVANFLADHLWLILLITALATALIAIQGLVIRRLSKSGELADLLAYIESCKYTLVHVDGFWAVTDAKGPVSAPKPTVIEALRAAAASEVSRG